jgi:DNA-binding transcriptional ArsR family regulator
MSLPLAAPAASRAGDADIAAIGALVADPARCRTLLALDDGRALPASGLAAEAGVSPATASSHLRKPADAGLLAVEAHGRHRYYRLSGPAVGNLIEVLQQLAPAQPIRSLRQGTRANALREARTCYDHPAGRLGVTLMGAMLKRGYLEDGDGFFYLETARHDNRSGYGQDVD